jgi:hypothetical protein
MLIYDCYWNLSDKFITSNCIYEIKASYNGLSFNNIDGKYKRDIFLMYYHYIQ